MSTLWRSYAAPGQACRCAGVRVCGQVYRCAMCRYAGVQVSRCAGVRVYRCVCVQVCRCVGMYTCVQCAGMQVYRCTGVWASMEMCRYGGCSWTACGLTVSCLMISSLSFKRVCRRPMSCRSSGRDTPFPGFSPESFSLVKVGSYSTGRRKTKWTEGDAACA